MHSAMSVTLLSWPDNTANGSAKYWLIRFFESLLGNVDDDDDGGISLSLSSSLSPFFEFDFLIFDQKKFVVNFCCLWINEWINERMGTYLLLQKPQDAETTLRSRQNSRLALCDETRCERE